MTASRPNLTFVANKSSCLCLCLCLSLSLCLQLPLGSMEENSNQCAAESAAIPLNMEGESNDGEERDPEKHFTEPTNPPENRTLSSSPLAIVGAKVSYIESLDYEINENDLFKHDWRQQIQSPSLAVPHGVHPFSWGQSPTDHFCFHSLRCVLHPLRPDLLSGMINFHGADNRKHWGCLCRPRSWKRRTSSAHWKLHCFLTRPRGDLTITVSNGAGSATSIMTATAGISLLVVLPQGVCAAFRAPVGGVLFAFLKRWQHGGGVPFSGELSSAQPLWSWCLELSLKYAVPGMWAFWKRRAYHVRCKHCYCDVPYDGYHPRSCNWHYWWSFGKPVQLFFSTRSSDYTIS
ncbi:hypothetical protein GBA52_011746 [Prunus armeniaca]|nr:hypothetical protein GBA52_011746 [Prunus armeniaca]